MLNEVVISPMLHKVTGSGHSCKWVGGGVRSCGCGELGGGGKRGEGGQGREGVQLPDSLMYEAVLQKKLCVGWVGSPAMQRALRVRRVL